MPFKREKGELKRAKLDSSGIFFKKNISLVEASDKVALLIAKQKKPHNKAETLVKSCALKIVERVLGKHHCALCGFVSFSTLINSGRTSRSEPRNIFKTKLGHNYKKLKTPILNKAHSAF